MSAVDGSSWRLAYGTVDDFNEISADIIDDDPGNGYVDGPADGLLMALLMVIPMTPMVVMHDGPLLVLLVALQF